MEMSRRWQNSAWVRPLRRKSLTRAFQRRSRSGPEAWHDLPDGALGPITGMIAGSRAAFQMHSTGRTQLINLAAWPGASEQTLAWYLDPRNAPDTLHRLLARGCPGAAHGTGELRATVAEELEVLEAREE